MTEAVVVDSIGGLEALVGATLGPSRTVRIDQDRIDAFAEVTGDHQWIHVDIDRAASGPFQSTIAHGYLTLSLLPMLAKDLVRFDGFEAAINYGLDRVRFPAPVRVDADLRATAEVQHVERTPRGARAVIRYTTHNATTGDTVCVADSVALLIGGGK